MAFYNQVNIVFCFITRSFLSGRCLCCMFCSCLWERGTSRFHHTREKSPWVINDVWPLTPCWCLTTDKSMLMSCSLWSHVCHYVTFHETCQSWLGWLLWWFAIDDYWVGVKYHLCMSLITRIHVCGVAALGSSPRNTIRTIHIHGPHYEASVFGALSCTSRNYWSQPMVMAVSLSSDKSDFRSSYSIIFYLSSCSGP